MLGLCSGIVGGFTYSLLDDGFANILAVQTLRHGTNPFNYVSIRLMGGDPSSGGKPSGSTQGWLGDDTHHYFYLFKDKDYQFENCRLGRLMSINMLGTRVLSRIHCFFSGYNFVARIFPKKPNWAIVKCTKIFAGTIGGLLSLSITPTLRFRFSAIDSDRLVDDPAYSGAAYRTAKKVEAWHIGMLGTLLTGINFDWFSRVQANPIRFMTGVIEVTCANAIMILCIPILVANPYLLVPVAIGALLV